MIDLTNITLEQANKIECALIQLEDVFKDRIGSYRILANDSTYFTEQARENFASNADWWQEVFELIYGGEK